ncbi:cell division protein FtsZ [Fluviicoccus keumensis]|uniref:Cell division protein FtsZ n=1 Tax=Fluviicoccus keumensis TaxID=1435465 RepID=A0A4Q7YE31_9GAMM|nr:cell division protein FtsZ [Fluviicoccus keumensis]RZU35380.1 cell division protein FtsZ [Fluviicoccus keumensis]
MSIFQMADDHADNFTGNAVIKVFGIGGGGGNAVDHMVRSGLKGVQFICANTDMQALKKMNAPTLLQLGGELTRGLGAGAQPEVGRQAALEDRDRIRESLTGADMVFITAGMGGGTGTGGAPVVAEVAREMGILTVGVVTKPFPFEGKRMKLAEHGIDELAQHVDSLITIPNAKLLTVLGKVSLLEAFKAANNVLLNAVQGISDMITRPGLINVDFADVRTVMSEQGLAMMGTGSAKGEDRARIATELAIHSPLLDDIKLEGARGLLVSVAANESMGLDEYNTVGEIVNQLTSSEANVVIGTILDPDLGDEIRVTVVATGLSKTAPRAVAGSQAAATSRPRVAPLGGAPSVAPQPAPRPSYDDYEEPAINRRAPAPAAAKPATPGAKTSDLLNVPAFLRRQQNSDQ